MPLDSASYEFKTDPVAIAKVQRETIAKEIKSWKSSKFFTVDPYGLSYVAPKITQPKAKVETEIGRMLENLLLQPSRGPTEKYNEPITSSQHVGWWSKQWKEDLQAEPSVSAYYNKIYPSKKWYKKIPRCAEHEYVKNVAIKTGINPFSNKIK